MSMMTGLFWPSMGKEIPFDLVLSLDVTACVSPYGKEKVLETKVSGTFSHLCLKVQNWLTLVPPSISEK